MWFSKNWVRESKLKNAKAKVDFDTNLYQPKTVVFVPKKKYTTSKCHRRVTINATTIEVLPTDIPKTGFSKFFNWCRLI